MVTRPLHLWQLLSCTHCAKGHSGPRLPLQTDRARQGHGSGLQLPFPLMKKKKKPATPGSHAAQLLSSKGSGTGFASQDCRAWAPSSGQTERCFGDCGRGTLVGAASELPAPRRFRFEETQPGFGLKVKVQMHATHSFSCVNSAFPSYWAMSVMCAGFSTALFTDVMGAEWMFRQLLNE